MTVTSANMFADLVPTATAAPASNIPLAQRGPHPVLTDYRTPDGHMDLAAYSAAVQGWMHTPAAGSPAPAPAPAPGGTPAPTPAVPGAPATPPGSSPSNALAAWNTFYSSPTYQVPLQQGFKAVNTHYAALGAEESGAAMKAISDYGAGQASQALGTYMDQLYRQEALGESAAAATAGVGENMVGQVSQNNNNAASATGNAALVAGQGSANTWNAVGSGIGQLGGVVAGAMGSSYHPANALAPTYPTSNYSSPTGNYIYGTGTGWNG